MKAKYDLRGFLIIKLTFFTYYFVCSFLFHGAVVKSTHLSLHGGYHMLEVVFVKFILILVMLCCIVKQVNVKQNILW
jgi:hypothetical protein